MHCMWLMLSPLVRVCLGVRIDVIRICRARIDKVIMTVEAELVEALTAEKVVQYELRHLTTQELPKLKVRGLEWPVKFLCSGRQACIWSWHPC